MEILYPEEELLARKKIQQTHEKRPNTSVIPDTGRRKATVLLAPLGMANRLH